MGNIGSHVDLTSGRRRHQENAEPEDAIQRTWCHIRVRNHRWAILYLMLVENRRGNYFFLRGIAPYSAGVVAGTGFEVVHVRFARYIPLRSGFDAVEAHLKRAGRPRQAMCGMELRSPKPFSFTGFNQFNAGYIDVLKKWDILFDGMNPVARTNIAPEVNPPGEPSLYGFSYTVPSKARRKTFVVAGAGELPEGSLEPKDVVRRGESSAAAIQEKAHFVMGLMEGRLRGLSVGWSDVTVSQIYTVHETSIPLLSKNCLNVWKKAERMGSRGTTRGRQLRASNTRWISAAALLNS